jgi:serine acetyltransferase
MPTISVGITEAMRPAENPAGALAHVRDACWYNSDLSERVMWCLGVDWHRTLDKLGNFGLLDRLFHAALCWEWWAVANYRFAYWVHNRRIPYLGRARFLQRLLFLQQGALLRLCYFTSRLTEALSGARLNALAEIGPGLLLAHTGSCGIGAGVRIGHTFTLHQDANVMARSRDEPGPTIGDKVTVYSGARIIGPVCVGDNARVGANAVVSQDLPSGCLAVGVPARPIQPGEHPQPYPASAQLYDLLETLLQRGDLEEISPGRYLDSATGRVVIASFSDPSEGESG